MTTLDGSPADGISVRGFDPVAAGKAGAMMAAQALGDLAHQAGQFAEALRATSAQLEAATARADEAESTLAVRDAELARARQTIAALEAAASGDAAQPSADGPPPPGDDAGDDAGAR